MTTRDFNTYVDDSFGLCMRGWLQYMSWSYGGNREGTILDVGEESIVATYHDDGAGNFANSVLMA